MRPRIVLATLAAAAVAALGGGTLLASPAGAAPAAVSSSTSLSVNPATITLGDDSAAVLSFAVTDNSGINATGSVTVKAQQANGNRVLCTANLVIESGTHTGIGSCRMGDASLFPGTQQLFAAYSGNGTLAGSQSGLVPVTVNPAVTEPGLTQSHFTTTFGQEQNDTMTVTAGPRLPGEFAPSGAFTVTAIINGTRQQVCSGTLPANVDADTNSGTCAPTGAQLPVGLWAVFAHYGGDSTYAAGDTPAEAIKVSQVQSTTTLGLPASLALDKESGAKVPFSVGPAASTPPTGQVSASATSAATGRTTSLCAGSLTSGAGSCKMTAAQLAPGKYLVTASYGGDTNYTAASSAAKPFTITKVPTKTALTRPRVRVRFGHEQTDPLSAAVTARNGARPAGKVTIKNGTATICTITLKGGKGKCALTARRLRVGTYHLTASYPGSATFAKSASGKVTLIVTK